MDGSTYKDDVRSEDPNQTGHRQARFREGWRKAVEGEEYGSAALEDLTWDNLGYRLGKLFGDSSLELIDQQYEWCVRQQRGK